jgi:hypothetical protein
VRRTVERGWVFVIPVVVTAVLVVAVGTTIVYARHRNQVESGIHVTADAEPLRCDGTSVALASRPSDRGLDLGDRLGDVATMVPEMNCRLRFFVENSSGHDVTIRTISLPVTVGLGGGAAVESTRLDPIRNQAVGPLPGGVGATWIVEDALLDGEQSDYAFTLVFRPDGCSSPDATLWIEWPQLTVMSWGRTYAIEPETPLVGFVGSEQSSCDG